LVGVRLKTIFADLEFHADIDVTNLDAVMFNYDAKSVV
jgi:hypothetical protein